jgi:hypothetical protein
MFIYYQYDVKRALLDGNAASLHLETLVSSLPYLYWLVAALATIGSSATDNVWTLFIFHISDITIATFDHAPRKCPQI